MQHLDIERIAAFDHEAPTVDELAHLAACLYCRAERSALAELSQLAMQAVNDAPAATARRLTEWDSLSVRLRAEKLITSPPAPAEVLMPRTAELRPRHVAAGATGNAEVIPLHAWISRATPRNRTEWWRAAAAALLLVVGGGALGRMSAGAPVLPVSESNVSSAGIPLVGLGGGGFSSLTEANRVLTTAQRNYERAALWLAANDTTARSSEMVRRRLAALDQMVAASRAGLEGAPQDPVLSHYYYTAYAMREATLQQLGGALPVGRSIERF